MDTGLRVISAGYHARSFGCDCPAIEGDNIPRIRTEVSWVRVGPLELLTVPGELMPELAVGGYDGSLTGHPDVPIIDADNPNPPDLSSAPAGPYMKAHLRSPHRWLVGMGQDELGYIVPPYNFQLHGVDPWFSEADGDHYEETNSLGPLFAPTLDDQYALLMGWIGENGL